MIANSTANPLLRMKERVRDYYRLWEQLKQQLGNVRIVRQVECPKQVLVLDRDLSRPDAGFDVLPALEGWGERQCKTAPLLRPATERRGAAAGG